MITWNIYFFLKSVQKHEIETRVKQRTVAAMSARPFENRKPGMIVNEQRRETGITIFQYMSNCKVWGKMPIS